MSRLKNWAGNVEFSAERLESPRSISHLRDIVAGSDRVHVLGTGHSFSRIADTTGTLVSVRGLPEVFEIVPGGVRVSAGMRLGSLAERLHACGLALHNMPSLPHISLAGACATATHGSGTSSLSALVRSIEMVTADGEVTTLKHDGVVVSLGALGVVTTMELAVVPTFDVEQRVYEGLPWQVLLDRFDEIFASAYSVSVFTGWRGDFRVWVKSRTDADLTWTGARAATRPLHPVVGLSGENCTPQLGVPGPWHERLPHFRAEFTPSVGAELQSEYLVAREHARVALQALGELSAQLAPVVQTTEIRTVDADECWLSPAHRRPSVAFHFTWTPDATAVDQVEAALAPWSPRPHWGKLFSVPPEDLALRYDRWMDFRRLMTEFDPSGTFRSPVLDEYFPA